MKIANHVRSSYICIEKNNTPTKGYYWYVGEQELEKKYDSTKYQK